jgi:hypothetical protein
MIFLKIKRSNNLVLVLYDVYILRSKRMQGVMIFYHIGYVDVGKTLI